MTEKKVLAYITGKTGDGDNAGVIIGVFEKYLDIGTTEEHGGDSHALLDVESTRTLLEKLSEALKIIEGN